MKIIALLAGALLSFAAHASPPLYRNWSYVNIRSDSISIEIGTDSKIEKIQTLHVEQDGKPVAIAHEVYERVEHPLINEIKIEACQSTTKGTCSILSIPFVDQSDEVPDDEAIKELSIELQEGQVVRHGIYRAQPGSY